MSANRRSAVNTERQVSLGAAFCRHYAHGTCRRLVPGKDVMISRTLRSPQSGFIFPNHPAQSSCEEAGFSEDPLVNFFVYQQGSIRYLAGMNLV